MQKLVIIEKDSVSANMLITLAEAINLEFQVHLSWNPAVLREDLSQVAAIFLNIEMTRIKFDKLQSFIESHHSDRTIPLVYLYTHRQSTFMDLAEVYPYTHKLKKPLRMESVVEVLNRYIDLEKIPGKEERLQAKLNEYETYAADSAAWLNSLKALVEG